MEAISQAPLEWRKVRTLGEGRLGDKLLLVARAVPQEAPAKDAPAEELAFPEVFVIKRAAKVSPQKGAAGTPQGRKDPSVRALQEARAALAVQAACGKCEHLVKTFGVWQDGAYLYTAFEYCEGGDLFTWMMARGGGEEKVGKMLARQMLAALLELHSRGLAHTDIRLENFQVAAGGRVKLADFSQVYRAAMTCDGDGLCQVRQRLIENAAVAGHQAYFPPELRRAMNEEKFDASKVDCYQLGVALFALLAKRYPTLPQERDSMLATQACASGGLSEECRSLLRQLLAARPEDRPTVKEALEHPWLRC